MNTTAHVPPEVAATLPPNCDALIVQGACLEPEVCDGDLVLFARGGVVSVGDLAIIWPRVGSAPMLTRLVYAPPPVLGPLAPGSEVGYLVVCEQTNLAIKAEQVSRIDRVAAVVPAATAIFGGDRS